MFFIPNIILNSVLDIDKALLNRHGIRALILDADNTLLTYGTKTPEKDILTWLDYIKKQKVPVLLASNNKVERIMPLANELGIDFFSFSLKPLPFVFLKAKKRFGLKNHEIGVVGDQIFTDVLGGNICGFKTILVEPIELEKSKFHLFKRKLEKPFRKCKTK